MNSTHTTGIILFAHGSRDPQWRFPFEAILQSIRAQHTGPTELAFLECMDPSLPKAIDAMAQTGVKHINVIPVFLAVGSHVRKDLPTLLDESRAAHPALSITASAAIGEQIDIQQAIARFALSTLNQVPQA
jgi:sirohydrochlorin cobaltochelatase